MLADVTQSDTTTELAIEILIWLSGQPDRMQRFLDISGVQADEIRNQIGRSAFQRGIVAFIMNHEPDLMDFSQDRGVPIQHVVRCHERWPAV